MNINTYIYILYIHGYSFIYSFMYTMYSSKNKQKHPKKTSITRLLLLFTKPKCNIFLIAIPPPSVSSISIHPCHTTCNFRNNFGAWCSNSATNMEPIRWKPGVTRWFPRRGGNFEGWKFWGFEGFQGGNFFECTTMWNTKKNAPVMLNTQKQGTHI